MKHPTRLSVRRVVTVIACVAVIAIAFVVGGLVHNPSLDANTRQVHQNSELIEQLQQAQAAQAKQAKLNAGAFATVLYRLADNFATPPYPDPSRVKAVGGMCDTAAFFYRSAGNKGALPTCPAK